MCDAGGYIFLSYIYQMEFRNAQEADIPAIISLLKQSLGESLMPKSDRYWKWKHQENPFGASPVLLCLEKDQLVGVRAFMRWTWMQHGRRYRAIRAVDTATHPGHQGKGIFKKLTLSLIEHCEQEGDHFVFNTPNNQSKPGYLKMGWEEAGKLPVRMTFQRPVRMAMNVLSKPSDSGAPSADAVESENLRRYLSHPKLAALINDHLQQQEMISTHYSPAYLTWRYGDVPVASYVAVGEEQAGELTGLVIGRIKPGRWGREFRITDCFLSSESDGRSLMEKLKAQKATWRTDYTTMSATVNDRVANLFGGVRLSAGPTVTVRSLVQKDLQPLKNFSQWSPALGDLELF